MSHTSSCALKPNPHLSNLHGHTYQNGPIKTRVVTYDVIITLSSLSTNQCLKYGSNKVTIVQFPSSGFYYVILITSQWRHFYYVTKKPKFDSRAVNIFNWLWITISYYVTVIQPRLLLISVPWSSRHLNNSALYRHLWPKITIVVGLETKIGNIINLETRFSTWKQELT